MDWAVSVVSSSMASVAGASSVVSVAVDIDLEPSSTTDDFGRSVASMTTC